MIRCSSVSEELINDMCILLAYCGVFACKLNEYNKKYNVTSYTLSIPKKYANQFQEVIGLNVPVKATQLNAIVEYNNVSITRHDEKELIDKIPALGHLIASIGKSLKLPGQSRTYGRWAKKEAIGRRTLFKYIEVFEIANKNRDINIIEDQTNKINILKQAVNSTVIWDEIVELEYLEDPKEYVYDFTVPGNDSFMVDCGVLVHNTLNTFHLAGVASKSNINQGVPRFKELIGVSRNIKSPMVTVLLKEPYCYDKEYSRKILNELAITTIKQLTISSEIYFDGGKTNDVSSEDAELMRMYNDFSDINPYASNDTVVSPWVLKLQFDKMKMMDKNIKMSDIYYAIISRFNNDRYDMSCVYTDDNAEKLMLRIQCLINPSEETQDECDEEDMICVLKAFEKTILNDITLTGIKNINGASMDPQENHLVYNTETKEFEKKKRWVIYTVGSNLKEIMTHPAVDSYKTFSNDIYETYETLGIEAARQVLFDEIVEVFDLAGSYVNARHINLLVDTMTNRGSLMSIDRHGINKSDRGPLAKCSFEETPDIIARAAIFGELDKVNSVSSNIMLGQEVPIGTGSVGILFDEESFFNSIIDVEQKDEYRPMEAEYTEKSEYVTRYCENLF